jgi:hypothetical protein
VSYKHDHVGYTMPHFMLLSRTFNPTSAMLFVHSGSSTSVLLLYYTSILFITTQAVIW